MSTTEETPPRGRQHRHTRSAAMPLASASSQNPQNPHHLNEQAQNPQSDARTNQQESASQTTTPPRTPRRDNQHPSHNTFNSNARESGSKQKSRNKHRPKNVMTSPAVTRNGRNISPPLTGTQSGIPPSAKPINTPSTAAYAGPTFHASPAPSALPIPSFYSKSVPESPGVKGLRTLKESRVKKESSSPNNMFTPTSANSQANSFQREESPLDIFFKADREEKARARSASSQTTAVANGPFQRPAESPRISQTPPALLTHSRPRHTSRMSSNGMFAMELDGETDPGTPYGPAFSTPYAERIHAVRTSSQPIQSTEQFQESQQQSVDRSEALKAYLFSGISSDGMNSQASPLSHTSSTYQQTTPAHASGLRSAVLPTRPQYNNHSLSHEQKSSNYIPRGSGRSSGLRQEVTPTKTPIRTPDHNSPYAQSPTLSRLSSAIGQINGSMISPGPSPEIAIPSESQVSDIQGIEESLRRILKLDPAGSSSITGGSIPAASASVPNYVGGRPPPMNGKHNGVMGS